MSKRGAKMSAPASTKIENWFMAATMLPFLLPAMMAVQRGEWVTALLILASGASSALYHAAESQKHKMTGINARLASPRMNAILINSTIKSCM